MNFDIKFWVEVAAFLGGGISMGFGAIGAAICEGYTAACANEAISRNTEISGDIFKSMLVGQAIAESASIFALVISMILLFTKIDGGSIVYVCVPLAAGITMGLGAIGSGLGAGFPAGAACTGIARQPKMSARLTTNMLIGSAVCQTPSIFALVVSLILIYNNFSTYPINPTWAAVLGAGISTGIGTIGPAIGGGLVAKACCDGMARNPGEAGQLTNVMLLGQAISQTPSIYTLLVSFILIFKASPATTAIAPAMALLGSGICMGIGAIGPGAGIGSVGYQAVKWVARTKEASGDIKRVMLVGMAVTESTAIYALVISLILVFVV